MTDVHKKQKTGDIVHKCRICGTCTDKKEDIMKHFEKSHLDSYIIAFSCPYCNITYKSGLALKKHITECLKDNGISMTSSKAIDQETILLKLINKVFKVINKNPIKKLTEFKNISRNQLVGEHIDNIMEEMEDEFYECFSKADCGFYRKKLVDKYFICALKGATKAMGFKFISKRNKKYKNGICISDMAYSICKKV